MSAKTKGMSSSSCQFALNDVMRVICTSASMAMAHTYAVVASLSLDKIKKVFTLVLSICVYANLKHSQQIVTELTKVEILGF